jgi:hypothetical protein
MNPANWKINNETRMESEERTKERPLWPLRNDAAVLAVRGLQLAVVDPGLFLLVHGVPGGARCGVLGIDCV